MIPTLEGTPFSARLLPASTGLLPLFVSRRLRIRNEKKGCSPCFSSSAHRLSPPPPHSPGPGATAPVRPGHFFRGSVCLVRFVGGWGPIPLSELSGPPCAIYRGSGRRLRWELLIFLPEQGLPVIPEAALQIVGPPRKASS